MGFMNNNRKTNGKSDYAKKGIEIYKELPKEKEASHLS